MTLTEVFHEREQQMVALRAVTSLKYKEAWEVVEHAQAFASKYDIQEGDECATLIAAAVTHLNAQAAERARALVLMPEDFATAFTPGQLSQAVTAVKEIVEALQLPP